MTDTREIFLVNLLTDLHAGSGTSYTRNIDRVVQRDGMGIPFVRGSGVKGAMRDAALGVFERPQIENIFGSFVSDRDTGFTKPSKLFASDLQLVAMPCNYNDRDSYVLVTCPSLLEDAQRYLSLETQSIKAIDEADVIRLGDLDRRAVNVGTNLYSVKSFVGQRLVFKALYSQLIAANAIAAGRKLVLVSDADFLADILPNSIGVNARNQLERGISQNLWFEEVVPRKSVFVTELGYNKKHKDSVTSFTDYLAGEQQNSLSKADVFDQMTALLEEEDLSNEELRARMHEIARGETTWTPPLRIGSGKTVGLGQTRWNRIRQESRGGIRQNLDHENAQLSNLESETSDTEEEKTELVSSANELRLNRLNSLKKLLNVASSSELKWIERKEVPDLQMPAGAGTPIITTSQSKEIVLHLSSENMTALNRLPSLMRSSLFELFSNLAADIASTEKDSTATARRAVASLLQAKLLEEDALAGKSSFKELKTCIETGNVSASAMLWMRKKINQALEQLKTLAACCHQETPKAA